MTQSPTNCASYFDHTLLKAEAKESEIDRLCQEARDHGFASVCVNPWYVTRARKLLAGSPVMAITVVGFPLGASTTASKASETKDAIAAGAQEVDMVVNLGAVKSGQWTAVEDDIRAVVQAAGSVPVKVILETAALTADEKVATARAAKSAGAAFVKTSTGFHASGGATVEDVALLRRTVGPTMGVKASGGIRTAADARRMIEAGATRLGASASVAILHELTGSGTKGSTPHGKSDY